MKTKLLSLFMLLAATSSMAQGYQLTPECYVEFEPDKYIVHFTLPQYTLEDDIDGNEYGERDSCGTFTEIVMDDGVDYDVTDEPGYPKLPFFSLNLILPSCATAVSAYMLSCDIVYDYPPYQISPAAIDSIIYVNYGYADRCLHDYYYYGYSSEYPNGFYQNFYSVSNIYSPFGANGVTFSIFPFAYYPDQWYMNVLQEAIFVIEFNCGDLISTIEDYLYPEDISTLAAAVYFDTFNGMNIQPCLGTNGRYLIVAANSNMEESLLPYVSYKQSQNYDVEVLYLNIEGGLGNSWQIKHLIDNNYLMPHPDYVLLVGNLTEIPPFTGIDNGLFPYSDDNYHPMLGRWIIGEAVDIYGAYADLRNIIDKTIFAETYYQYRNSVAWLFSGTDKKSRVSNNFYKNTEKIADNSFTPMGISWYLCDGRYYYNNTSQAWNLMVDSLRTNPRFFIYNGHGYHNQNTSAIASPYWLYASHIPSINNGQDGPLGFGFACSLNTYVTDYNFGARWVASMYAGGPTFYGATATSLRPSDNCLAKQMFKDLRKLTDRIGNFPISFWLRRAELNYYFNFQTIMRGVEIAKYNLIGDPTFAIYGMDGGSFAPFCAPKRSDKEFDNFTKEEKSISHVCICDISGKTIAIINSPSEIRSLPFSSGVYVVKTIYTDGTFNINKIIK